MATPQAQKPNAGWDTRAWLIGLVGGNICSVIFAWCSYPPMERILDRALTPRTESVLVDILETVTAILGVLVLPGLVSGLARRRTFLWGLLPLSCFWAWTMLEEAIEKGWHEVTNDFWSSTLACLACLFVSSGPVSLLRLLLRRRKEKQLRAQAAYEAQRQAAAVPQEGVWPPPPSYMGKEASDYRP